MAQISFIYEKIDWQNLFGLMSTLENCLISTYLLWFSTRVQMKKNCGDMPSACLKDISCVENQSYIGKLGCML